MGTSADRLKRLGSSEGLKRRLSSESLGKAWGRSGSRGGGDSERSDSSGDEDDNDFSWFEGVSAEPELFRGASESHLPASEGGASDARAGSVRSQASNFDVGAPTVLDAAQQAAATEVLRAAVQAARGRLRMVTEVGADLGQRRGRWGGGSRSPDGRLFFAPRTANRVLCIDPARGTIEPFGEKITKRTEGGKRESKFSAAVVTSDNKAVILVPATARFVTRIDLETGKKSTLGDDLGPMDAKFGHAVEACGKIFAAPHNFDRVLVVDINANRVVKSNYLHQPRCSRLCWQTA